MADSKAKASASDVLKSLNAESIDAELAEITSKIDALNHQADALRMARKMVEYREHGRPKRGMQRKPKEAKAKPSSAHPDDESLLVEKIAKALRYQQPASAGAVGAAIGEHAVRVAACMRRNTEQFVETQVGWKLAS